jgi:hypothetical protein
MISDGRILYLKNFPPALKPNERLDPGDLLADHLPAVSLDYGAPPFIKRYLGQWSRGSKPEVDR